MPKQSQGANETEVLSVTDRLEIFQDSAMKLAAAGVPVKFHGLADGRIVMTIDGAFVCHTCKKFRLMSQMTDSGTCQNCAKPVPET